MREGIIQRNVIFKILKKITANLFYTQLSFMIKIVLVKEKNEQFCHQQSHFCKTKWTAYRQKNDFVRNIEIQEEPWLVQLSGLSVGLQTKGPLVQFPVRAHVWVEGQVPSVGHTRGTHTLIFLSLSFSFPPPLSKNK